MARGMIEPFESYSTKYQRCRLTRQDGIIELCLHTDGGSLKWDPVVHEELGYCFSDIANDPENKVVIITGEGETFCTEMGDFGTSTLRWSVIHREALRLLNNLLAIEVPVIAAVNGPAHIHAELLLMSNIVISADHADFQDGAHFIRGWAPTDGSHLFWPLLLGPTRGSYFLLTGEIIDAHKGLGLGLVNEVLPGKDVKVRAWELAQQIARQPDLVRRYTRAALCQEIKRLMHEQLSHGLALEGMAFLEADS